MNQTNDHKWLTVDQAYLSCLNQGLSRTKKTVRQWCRLAHVDCEKQVTPNGEQWVIENSSLDVKIATELEFLSTRSQNEKSETSSEPVLTSANEFEPVHTGAHSVEHVRTNTNSQSSSNSASTETEIAELKGQVRSLEVDKLVRDQILGKLEAEVEKNREALLGQSRYIGHLETLAIQKGASPEAKYLSSPVPNRDSDSTAPVEENKRSEEQIFNQPNSTFSQPVDVDSRPNDAAQS